MIFFTIALSLIFILILLEATMYFLTRHPRVLSLFPRKFRNSITYLYIQGDRKILHFQEGCGVYSPDLSYTLKPGTFTFTEIEFSNEYRVNSLGVRDEEGSLIKPEIIFLGDSFTLGWGVNQEQTYVKLLEKKIQLKTLNTSIPSFGTVREMLILKKVDKSQLKCLILQYCGDDYDENLRYYLNGNRPQVMREETFHKLSQLHSQSKQYFPGKYINLKIRKKINEWKPKTVKPETITPMSEAELFIHVLQQNADQLTPYPLIVFELNGINQSNAFIKDLKKIVTDSNQPAFIRKMIILDMTQYLEDKHFFVLDGHVNPAGHEIITDILCEAVLQTGILSPSHIGRQESSKNKA